MISRRSFGLEMLATLAGVTVLASGRARADSKKEVFAVNKTPEEWKKQLTAQQYYVLREHGTERAGTSPLDKTYAPGTDSCAGCDQVLYASEHKCDSGTGWPSFYQAVDDKAVATTIDKSWFMTRTEVHCSRCGGHLGHVFDDGPRPTGKRH